MDGGLDHKIVRLGGDISMAVFVECSPVLKASLSISMAEVHFMYMYLYAHTPVSFRGCLGVLLSDEGDRT